MPPKSTTATKKSGAEHTSYQDMIADAISTLKERNGSSRQALKKYVKANNKIKAEDAMFDSLFNRALKAGVEKGVFSQPKGSSGGTKLAKPLPKPAAPKAKVEGKTPAAKPKKATTTKKTTTTAKPKAAAKPKVTKSAVAKPKKDAAAPKAKAAPKPKKAAAPKDAPAVVDKPAVLGKTKSGRVTKTTPKTAAPKTKKPAAKKATPKKATPKKVAA